MNINQIKYFVSTFELGSFSAAARSQYVTVQAVSKAIADLERELDKDLFVRKNRSVHPTEFGERFYSKALPALRAFEELEKISQEQDDDSNNDQILRILLCTPPFHGHEQFIEKLSRILSNYLGITVQMNLSLISDGLDKLIEKRADALVTVGALERPFIACSVLGTIEPGVVMAPDHPLAAAPTVHISDMAPYPVASSKEFDSLNDSILSVFQRNGLQSPLVPVNRKGFDLRTFLHKEQGLIFNVGIAALTRDVPNMTMRLVDPLDTKPIPVCLSTLKNRNDAITEALLKFTKVPFNPLGIAELR